MADLAWLVGGYLAGTLPSALIVAAAKHGTGVLPAGARGSGETDPHILMAKELGTGWTATAATMDVLKGFVYILVARGAGHLPEAWLAATGGAVVAGHTYPFYARQWAGRGLAAAAGVLLVLLPVEMTVAGVVIVLGSVAHATGLAATVGIGSVPLVALLQGQPGSFVWMALAIFLLILVRRVEGVGSVIRGGVSAPRAVAYRAVFDSSGPPAPSRFSRASGREKPLEGAAES